MDKIAEAIGWPDEAGRLALCNVTKYSAILIESYWLWPKPPEDLIVTDPDQHIEWFKACINGSPHYKPGAVLRWRQVEGPMPTPEASEALRRRQAEGC